MATLAAVRELKESIGSSGKLYVTNCTGTKLNVDWNASSAGSDGPRSDGFTWNVPSNHFITFESSEFEYPQLTMTVEETPKRCHYRVDNSSKTTVLAIHLLQNVYPSAQEGAVGASPEPFLVVTQLNKAQTTEWLQEAFPRQASLIPFH